MDQGIFLSLGGNIGDVQSTFVDAIELLEERGISIVKESSLYRTEPVGNTDQDWFYNQVIQVETNLSPQELLNACLEVEKLLGRIRTDEHWGPRTIDIDIICYNQEEVNTETLTLPHPEACKRKFVLLPLAEIAPDFKAPVMNQTLTEILKDCEEKDSSEVVKVS
jgi:2-amino-4-hydroxy-6-hydroxymethyldihydropteridine diphosphokinase